MSSSFNAFQIKRKAHAVSRKESSLTPDQWNPFRHVWTEGPQRRQTWDAEAAIGNAEAPADLEPLEPSLSAPPGNWAERTQSAGDAIVPSQATEQSDNSLRHRKAYERPETPINGWEKKKPKKPWRFVTIYPKEPFTFANQVQRTFLAAPVNVLLVCVPAGMTVNYVLGPSLATFIVNFVAIIPLFFVTDLATDEISKRLGQNLSNFLIFSTSNLFQLISCILLLVHRQVTVLKLSLIGGVLANILLLLGLAILFGGLHRSEQFFNAKAAHTSSLMLSLASTSLLIPTACLLLSQTSPGNVIKQSRGVAVVLILIYGIYLRCILGTHQEVFSQYPEKVPARPSKNTIESGAIKKGLVQPAGLVTIPGQDDSGSNNGKLRRILDQGPLVEEALEEDEPQLHIIVAVLAMLTSAALLFLCTDYVVNSIGALTENHGLSATFIGLILLPLPNCDSAPITVAIRDDLTSALDYTVVRSIQTALLVLPVTILLGWWIGIEEATLVFDGFEVISLFASIILLNLIM